MKTHALLLAIAAHLTLFTHGEEESKPPPKNLRAPWVELAELKFTDWKIAAYKGFAEPFDGGSKVFSFETENGLGFAIMAANPEYWTAADLKAKKQVFYLVHKNRFYRIESESDGEVAVISMLEAAAAMLEGTKNEQAVNKLIERIRSRVPISK